MDTKYHNTYRIPSARAPWHDYNGGIYFVTFCTAGKRHYLGEITTETGQDPSMRLTTIGECVTQQMENISNHLPCVEIPLYVVMPNHVHALVYIDTPYIPSNEADSHQNNRQNTLAVAVGSIKAAATRFAHAMNLPFAWQRRYYDRIVRNEEELNHIAAYIENNVTLWDIDCYCSR
jgi:putative transposase